MTTILFEVYINYLYIYILYYPMKSNNTKLVYFSILLLSLILLAGCNTTLSPNTGPDSLLPAKYDLIGCQKTPWAEWLENSDIQFIKAPTEQEVLTMFYSQVHNITLTDITVRASDAICKACSCSRGTINAYVMRKDIGIMEDTGWVVSRYQ